MGETRPGAWSRESAEARQAAGKGSAAPLSDETQEYRAGAEMQPGHGL
jgi:hypothetical protein